MAKSILDAKITFPDEAAKNNFCSGLYGLLVGCHFTFPQGGELAPPKESIPAPSTPQGSPATVKMWKANGEDNTVKGACGALLHKFDGSQPFMAMKNASDKAGMDKAVSKVIFHLTVITMKNVWDLLAYSRGSTRNLINEIEALAKTGRLDCIFSDAGYSQPECSTEDAEMEPF